MMTNRWRVRLGALGALGFLASGCATVAALPDQPDTPTTIEAVRDQPTSQVLEQDPYPLYCLDGSERIPEIRQVSTWPDGSTEATIQRVEGCQPWPTHCQDGSRFIPPTVLSSYQPQCLKGLALYDWWILLRFDGEAPIARRVMRCESHGNPGAVGPAVRLKGRIYRAHGLMQILVADGGRRNGRTASELHDPETNLDEAVEIRWAEGWDAWDCY